MTAPTFDSYCYTMLYSYEGDVLTAACYMLGFEPSTINLGMCAPGSTISFYKTGAGYDQLLCSSANAGVPSKSNWGG